MEWERIVSLTNGAETTEYPHLIELCWTSTSYNVQKLTRVTKTR